MIIEDKRKRETSVTFFSIVSGVVFENGDRLYLKLDSPIEDINNGVLCNAINLNTNNPVYIADKSMCRLLDAKIVIEE